MVEISLSNDDQKDLHLNFKLFDKYDYFDIENNDSIFFNIVNNICDSFFEIQNLIDKHDYVIVRKFGISLPSLVSLTYFLSKGKLLRIPSLDNNSFVAIFKMQETNELSHTLADGFFHTDYSTHINTPDFVSLQVVRRDPKYPFYSRNSIVLLEEIIYFLERNNKDLLHFLSTKELPFDNGKKVVFQKIIDINLGVIKFHEKLISDYLLKENKYDDLKKINEFSVLCGFLSKDFVLDNGDLVILSNKSMLHKRGAATLEFDYENKRFQGRIVNSIRYYK
jgi:hypothetical protein